MQVKLLKEVVGDIAGKPASEIVDLLFGKKDVNEFLIAKKLKLTINQTRNILYKLADNGLVSFTRKKDKRKGWYIYFWTLDTLKSMELLENKLLKEIKHQGEQLKSRKTKRFYFCKTCNVEVGEETALLNNFTCLECGQIYSLAENDKIIKEVESKINKLRTQLNIINEEKIKLAETLIKKAKKPVKKKTKNSKKSKKTKKKVRKRKSGKKTKKKIRKKKKPKKTRKKTGKKKAKKSKAKKKTKKIKKSKKKR